MLAGVPTGATPIVPELPVIRTRGEGEQRGIKAAFDPKGLMKPGKKG
jgi:hypothetical protein